MFIRGTLFFSGLLFFCLQSRASGGNEFLDGRGTFISIDIGSTVIASSVFAHKEFFNPEKPSPLFNFLRFNLHQKKNRKLTAALLAFPFPLGMVGMHRIYLG